MKNLNLIRCTYAALAWGLFLMGCSESTTVQSRSSSTGAWPRNTGSNAISEDQPPNEVFGYQPASAVRHDITLEEIRQHVRNNTAAFIDARGDRDFALGHVRGALNVPPSQMQAHTDRINQALARDQLIIIYCGGPDCDSGDMVYEYLASQGYANMRVFKPGWRALSKESDLR
jgi:rhodanese-related sulfurtransferase